MPERTPVDDSTELGWQVIDAAGNVIDSGPLIHVRPVAGFLEEDI